MTSSLPGSFSPLVTLDPRAINLAHALDDFLHTRHIFTHKLHQHTITLLTYTTTFYITPKDYLDPSVSSDWALDRSYLNNSVKKFHTQTLSLRTDSHFRDWEDQYLQSKTRESLIHCLSNSGCNLGLLKARTSREHLVHLELPPKHVWELHPERHNSHHLRASLKNFCSHLQSELNHSRLLVPSQC